MKINLDDVKKPAEEKAVASWQSVAAPKAADLFTQFSVIFIIRESLLIVLFLK